MKVGFTGTRRGMSHLQIAGLWRVFVDIGMTSLHHGGCVGSDEEAHYIAYDLSVFTVVHQPFYQNKCFDYSDADELRPPKPYLERNKDIVDETDVLVATPDGVERLRSGTWSTVRYALKQGRTVYIVWPDGRLDIRR